MPTTVVGTIESTDTCHFTAKFTFDNTRTYSFAGTFEAIVPNLTCRQAIVTFNDITELATSTKFTGRVGPFDVQLNLDNGPTIKGVLNTAVMSRNLWGTGKWSQS
jgi:hypothetical protein